MFTHRDRGGNRSTHYPGNWIVSVRVRTEHPVQPLLYLSIHDGLINWELIVDKVVLINKDPYWSVWCTTEVSVRFTGCEY